MISIIIVSYNTCDILRDCLQSVFNEKEVQKEVIVIDNASTDGSVDMIKKEFPEVICIANTTNPGFSAANNQGITISKGEYIFLLNPDTVVWPGALSILSSYVQNNPKTVVGPRLCNSDNSLQVSAWKFPSVFNSLAELFFVHRLLGVSQYDVNTFNTAFNCDFLSGAAIFFHRSLLQKVSGLDVQLFWMEDVDFCYRAKEAGYAVTYLPQAVVTHLGGQSSSKNVPKVIANQLLSRLKFCRKHYSVFSFVFLHFIVFFHILSRLLVFSILHIFTPTPKAYAYAYAFKKHMRYLFLGDTSVA